MGLQATIIYYKQADSQLTPIAFGACQKNTYNLIKKINITSLKMLISLFWNLERERKKKHSAFLEKLHCHFSSACACPASNNLPLPTAKINLKAKQPDVTSSRED